jgi:hypothetical protein
MPCRSTGGPTHQVSQARTRQSSSGTRLQNRANQDSTDESAWSSVLVADVLKGRASREAGPHRLSTTVCSCTYIGGSGRWALARRGTGRPRARLTRLVRGSQRPGV